MEKPKGARRIPPFAFLGVNDGAEWDLSQVALFILNILFIGDIFASGGRGIVAQNLKELIAHYKIDLAIANAENSAGGFGITPLIAEELLSLGLDVLTGGNHSFDKREVYEYMGTHPRLLRPANYPNGLPGSGVFTGKTSNGVPYAGLNLQGRAHMSSIDCP